MTVLSATNQKSSHWCKMFIMKTKTTLLCLLGTFLLLRLTSSTESDYEADRSGVRKRLLGTTTPSTFPSLHPSSHPSSMPSMNPSLYPAPSPSPSPFKQALRPNGENAFGNEKANIGPWPECIGWECEDCRAYISTVAADNPRTKCLSDEYIHHRVIVITNQNGLVVQVPKRG